MDRMDRTISCVLWFGGDRCSQVALERVRDNPELIRTTQLADVRSPACRPPAHVRLVPTLVVRGADGSAVAYTGKQVHAFARQHGAGATTGDCATISATNLRYALGSRGGLETRAELLTDIHSPADARR